MSQSVDHLEATVRSCTDVMDSAATLLDNLSGMIRDTAGDPARVNSLADALDAKRKVLVDAVTANTPAANPPPPPTPAPTTSQPAKQGRSKS